MKQRMQVQGSKKYWESLVIREGSRAKNGKYMYGYYSGMFQAGCSIWKEQGVKGLYAGYILSYSSTSTRCLKSAYLLTAVYYYLVDTAYHIPWCIQLFKYYIC